MMMEGLRPIAALADWRMNEGCGPNWMGQSEPPGRVLESHVLKSAVATIIAFNSSTV